MDWRLIRFLHLLTILWALASLYFALDGLRGAIKPLPSTENWWEVARELHWFYLMQAFVWWCPVVIFWGILYAGAGGVPPKAERPLESQLNDRAVALRLLVSALMVGTTAAAIFIVWPNIDLAVANWFYMARRIFLFDYHIAPFTFGIQLLAKTLTWLAGICALLGSLIAITTKHKLLGFGLRQWLFLILVLVIGPGLLVNTVLKEHSGRPRPIHLVQFGGDSTFTPVFHSGPCSNNCSFVSGEASFIYALGFAVAVMASRRRKTLMETAVIAGTLVGFVRMGQGGHFLSDVIFAGVFMAIVVAVMYWFFSSRIFHGNFKNSKEPRAGEQTELFVCK